MKTFGLKAVLEGTSLGERDNSLTRSLLDKDFEEIDMAADAKKDRRQTISYEELSSQGYALTND
jgi:hypothetical protein